MNLTGVSTLSFFLSSGMTRRSFMSAHSYVLRQDSIYTTGAPTTPVTSIAISPVKMSIGRKSLTNLRSEMIFLRGKPVFYIFLPSTPPY